MTNSCGSGYNNPNDVVILSDAKNDCVSTGKGNDIVDGGGGNDTLDGGADRDLIFGGAGDDSLAGGSGCDTIYGGSGDDAIFGDSFAGQTAGGCGGGDWGYDSYGRYGYCYNADADVIYGDGKEGRYEAATTVFGADTIQGGGGADLIWGDSGLDGTGGGNDSLYGNDGNDTLHGEGGDDRLDGGSGEDLLFGGAGHDVLIGGTGGDVLTGGDGADDFVYLKVSDSPADPAAGSGGHCQWHGYDVSGVDLITDFSGHNGQGDVMDFTALTAPGADDDLIWGGTTAGAHGVWYAQDGGETVVYADTGNDGIADLKIRLIGNLDLTVDDFRGVIAPGPGPESNAAPAAGDDTWYLAVSSAMTVGADPWLLHNDTDPDNDTLTVTAISGQPSWIALSGGNLVIDAAPDTAGDYSFGYTVDDGHGHTATANVTVHVVDDANNNNGADLDELADGSNLTATNGADELHGTAGDDSIQGKGGDDTIYGGAGADSLQGQTGADSIYGGSGGDTLEGNGGSDTAWGGSGDDSIEGNLGNDALYGGTGADVVDGKGGDDTSYGGAGDDTMHGNKTADLLFGGAGDDTIEGDIGNDTLVGGLGNDSMQGNGDADTFVFDLHGSNDPWGLDDGHDAVQTYAPGVDVLQFDHVLESGDAPGITLADLEASISGITNDDGAGNAVVDFKNGASVTFEGVTASGATIDDQLMSLVAGNAAQIVVS